ncbi:hypothetical protein MtrunA17_Chr6g0450221 [Medicago truncatula]|uniref:Transmembrane protein n=1 Tax=Medicago truncatula TaxID=3880 RepID=A0A396H960_MEDTR|nr:hypothetical protein MtrunA17_Chr6g0450221 [Medicago truncatula]
MYLLQFRLLDGFFKNICNTFYLIWLSCVWIVWRDRNARIFKHQEDFIHHLLDKIKLQSYWWMKATHPNFAFNYYMWWLNPLLCLGSCSLVSIVLRYISAACSRNVSPCSSFVFRCINC